MGNPAQKILSGRFAKAGRQFSCSHQPLAQSNPSAVSLSLQTTSSGPRPLAMVNSAETLADATPAAYLPRHPGGRPTDGRGARAWDFRCAPVLSVGPAEIAV